METPPLTPLAWFLAIVTALQWPVVVAFAFALGRYVNKLEARLRKAESNLDALVTRHMPAVHRALADIQKLLLSWR